MHNKPSPLFTADLKKTIRAALYDIDRKRISLVLFFDHAFPV